MTTQKVPDNPQKIIYYFYIDNHQIFWLFLKFFEKKNLEKNLHFFRNKIKTKIYLGNFELSDLAVILR